MESLAHRKFWMGAVIAALALLVGLGTALGASAQQPPAQQPPPSKPATPATTPLSDVNKQADPAEDAAYKALIAIKPEDAGQEIQAGEEFLKKYPTSRYASPVYTRLTKAYFDQQQMDKFYAAGQKAIDLNPNDLQSLTLVGWVLPHNYNPNDLDADQKLDKAEGYLKRAISLVGTLVKPAALTDEEFAKAKNEALSRAHSGLGLVDFRRGKFSESVPELEQATTLVPNPDPTDFYVMGFDFQQLKRFSDAAGAFEKCSQLPSALQDRCKQNAEQSKRLAATGPAPSKP